MAQGNFRIEWDEAGLRGLVDGPIKADGMSRARAVRRVMKALAPEGESGALGESVDILDVEGRRGGGWIFRIGPTVDYAIFVVRGTGIYGTRGAPIFPRDAAFLIWEEAGEPRRARSVLGQRANNFMQQSIEAFR